MDDRRVVDVHEPGALPLAVRRRTPWSTFAVQVMFDEQPRTLLDEEVPVVTSGRMACKPESMRTSPDGPTLFGTAVSHRKWLRRGNSEVPQRR